MNDLPHNTNFTHANVQPHVSTLFHPKVLPPGISQIHHGVQSEMLFFYKAIALIKKSIEDVTSESGWGAIFE